MEGEERERIRSYVIFDTEGGKEGGRKGKEGKRRARLPKIYCKAITSNRQPQP